MSNLLSPFPREQTVTVLIRALDEAEKRLREAKEKAADLQTIVNLATHERDELINALIVAAEVKP